MTTGTNGKVISVILESNFTGHRSEYISHLMRYININDHLKGKYIFILNEKMHPLLRDLAKSENYSIRYVDFNKNHSNSITRSFWEWKLIEPVIRELESVIEIIFMDVDPYLVLLVLPRFTKLNLSVKGILFQPYIHFREIKGGISFLIKKVYKNYLLQKYSFTINSKIRKIFILNDKNTVEVMNNQIKPIFYNLPDPIQSDRLDLDEITCRNIREKYSITNGRKNLLVFGSIDDRKNLINIIDSLRSLPIETKNTIHLIISGKLEQTVREKYIEHIEKHKGEISVAYNDAFVGPEEREPLFEMSDLVLMPYVNFYSASSVLGHTIQHNKNVIVSNKGIMQRIVTENNVGIAVDPFNIQEIKEAIQQLLTSPQQFQYDGNNLMEEFSPINFSKTILSK